MSKKAVLVYFPFKLAEKADSGSKLRPLEMLKAFREWGAEENVEIIELNGTSEERAARFSSLKAEGKLDTLWFCYAENQTIPIWLTDPGHKPKKPFIDAQVFKFLKQRNVPMGIFYRDVYWKFDDLYPLKGLKKKVMQAVYRREEKFYEKYASAIFLPSSAMGKYVSINQPKVPLPPGGKVTDNIGVEKTFSHHGIYVGGIANDDYGLPLLLESLENYPADKMKPRLTVVCREAEYMKLPDSQKQRLQNLGVELKHISGSELTMLYRDMDYAYIPRLKSEYNNFSVPVKLVEYLSNGLPVVATDCDAQQEFIESGHYGLVSDDKRDDFIKAIETVAEQCDTYRTNIADTFLEKHSWLARVRSVKKTLVGES
ncbi:glycosyltransferase [Fictibacillus iocasae]|uniref:Glycosyltransferase n=1 Tax=Fictibacillus iocasae TaxID=2715437 RepID=A0ABW2NUJ4_9BACL